MAKSGDSGFSFDLDQLTFECQRCGYLRQKMWVFNIPWTVMLASRRLNPLLNLFFFQSQPDEFS